MYSRSLSLLFLTPGSGYGLCRTGNHVTPSRPTLTCSASGQAIPRKPRKPKKPKGYWSDIGNLKQELLDAQRTCDVLREGFMPTARELRELGRRDLDNAISKMGGYRKIAEQLGFSTSSKSRPRGYWNNFEILELELKAFLLENRATIAEGVMPTQKELRTLKRVDIVEAISKHSGMAEVAAKLGLSQRSTKKSKHYWKDWSRVEADIREFVSRRDLSVEVSNDPERPKIESRQFMPSQRELRSAGRADLTEAISDFHGGFREVAKKMGYASKKKDDFFYDSFYNLAREIYAFVLEDGLGDMGVMPSTAALKKAGRSDLTAAIVKAGGMAEVSQRLGLQYRVRAREAFKDWGLFRKSLLSFMEQHGAVGEIPSSRTLSNFGRSDLYQAILHHGGSREVADRMGLKRNYWQDFSNVGMQLLEFVDKHGTEGMMPTEKEFLEIGRSALNVAVSKFGHSQVAKRLGFAEPRQSPQVALDALLNQSASIMEDPCCENCEEGGGFLF